MQLSQVTIERFKSVDYCDLPVGSLNVLAGTNNCGKSSIIQAIHFAFTLFQSLNISSKWPSANKKTITVSPNELMYLPSNAPYSLGSGGRLNESRENAIEIEFTFAGGEQTSVSLRKGRITNVIVEPTNTDYARTLSTLEAPYSVYSPGLAGISRSETFVGDGILLRALARGDANSYLRNILFRLKEKNDKWIRFEQDLSNLFADTSIYVEYDQSIDEYIDVNVDQGGNNIPLDLSGTGLLQGIQILSYYHLFQPKLILLDEPDSHLHPNNQRVLCSLLSALANEHDVRIVMTTHSRHVIDALSDEAGLLWIDSGLAKKVGKEDQLEVLVDLGALDIGERLQASNRKAIVLTEDKTTKILNQVLEHSGFNMDKTLVLSYKGVTNVHMLDPLIGQIRKITPKPSPEIVVHRDRDYLQMDEVEVWNSGIRSLGAHPFVTEAMDMEDYLVSEKVMEGALKKIAHVSFQEMRNEMVRELREDAIKNYVNGRVDLERKKGNAGQIDHGMVAVSATKAYQSEGADAIKGKVKLSWYRRYLKNKHNINLDELLTESVLSDQTLRRISRKIFGTKR